MYILNKKIKDIYLEEAGFELRQGTYHLKQTLNKFVYIEIEIDLEEKWLAYYVKIKNLDEYYIPFYLEEYRIRNQYYNRVVYSFNQTMDALCRKNILWRAGIVKKPNSFKEKQYGDHDKYNNNRYLFH